MKLEGNLDLFSLRELIEMSIYSSVIGVLKLKGPQQTGYIFFRDGVAYHCTYGDLAGEVALTAIFEAKDATFTFVADAVADTTTLWGNITSLMDRCEAQAMRWQKVRAALPLAPIVPHLISNPGVESMSIETAHFSILAGIDGERTLDEIATLLSLELLDVYEAAARLQQDGLLDLRPVATTTTPSRSAPSSTIPPSDSGRTTSSVIDRILKSLHAVALPSAEKKSAPSYSLPLPSVDDDPILRLLRS